MWKILLNLAALIVVVFIATPISARPYDTSRVAHRALICSHAASTLENYSEADALKKLGAFIIKGIYTDYSRGKISKSEMRADLPALMYILIEDYDSIPEGDVEFLTEIVVDSFSDGESTYEQAVRGKSGIEAFTARKDKAEEIYIKYQCNAIVDALS